MPDAWILPFPAPVLLMVGGFLLFWSSDRFVEHAAHLARSLRVPPVVIGAMVLGFGTSLPELLVSVGAATDGAPEVAVGNVVGSNIANVGLILGTAALMAPLTTQRSLMRTDLPLGALAAVSLTIWTLNGNDLDRTIGLVLLAGFILYLWRVLSTSRRERHLLADEAALSGDDSGASEGATPPPERSVMWDLMWTAIGGVGVAYGATTFVKGARGTAEMLGVPEEVIALSLMALGTSLPELATTLAACRKGETDLAVGNVAGSNLFNILLVLGVCATGWTLPVSDAMAHLDFPVMCAFALLAFPVFSRDGRMGKMHGAFLVFLYLGYTVWIFTHGRT